MKSRYIVILSLIVGLGLATLWWQFPEAVGTYIVKPAMGVFSWVYTQIMFAPIHIAVTVVLVSLSAFLIFRSRERLREWGVSKSLQPFRQAPAYVAPQPVAPPIAAPIPPPPVQTTQLEKKE